METMKIRELRNRSLSRPLSRPPNGNCTCDIILCRVQHGHKQRAGRTVSSCLRWCAIRFYRSVARRQRQEEKAREETTQGREKERRREESKANEAAFPNVELLSRHLVNFSKKNSTYRLKYYQPSYDKTVYERRNVKQQLDRKNGKNSKTIQI